ncbi:MAG: hypothetical protein M1318_02365, partial [Firmicutes bacterium]|nr:hypothetical protein [Bacillota bacterium]
DYLPILRAPGSQKGIGAHLVAAILFKASNLRNCLSTVRWFETLGEIGRTFSMMRLRNSTLRNICALLKNIQAPL